MSLERLAALDAKPTLPSVHPLGIGYPGVGSPASGCGASFDAAGAKPAEKGKDFQVCAPSEI